MFVIPPRKRTYRHGRGNGDLRKEGQTPERPDRTVQALVADTDNLERLVVSELVSLVGTLLAATALALLHLVAGRVHSVGILPGGVWLSAGGGAAVAYVFVHILPELGRGHSVVGEPAMIGGILERYVYLVALLGFVLFYGLEHLAQRGAPRETARVDQWVFWIHVGSFGAYNALIGYLLVHRDEPGPVVLALFAGAMGLHFLVIDHGFHEHFQELYHDVGRWLLSTAVLVGWAIGQVVPVSETQLHVLFALLAGGAILNVMKEELPDHYDSRFAPFLAGATGYTLLLLSI